jgi:hypothetical protein
MREANPANGLILDKTAANWPASIAATGLALAAYPVGVERGFFDTKRRGRAHFDHLALLLEQPAGSRSRDATGHHGFYYHFLDMKNRTARLELRAVDDR